MTSAGKHGGIGHRMKRIVIACVAVLVLSGCDRATRNEDSTFLPDANGQTWQYVAKDQGYWQSEKQRNEWISQYLKMNHLCPNGYVITNRREVVTSDTLQGPIKAIYYEGRCTA